MYFFNFLFVLRPCSILFNYSIWRTLDNCLIKRFLEMKRGLLDTFLELLSQFSNFVFYITLVQKYIHYTRVGGILTEYMNVEPVP